MVLVQRVTYVGFSLHDGTASFDLFQTLPSFLPISFLSFVPFLCSSSKWLAHLFISLFAGLGRKDADLTEEQRRLKLV